MDNEFYYGWFSKTAYDKYGYSLWENTEGKEVMVTHVGKKLENAPMFKDTALVSSTLVKCTKSCVKIHPENKSKKN